MSNCKVISVMNQKGGVGKTVTALNVAVGLANKGNRVLAIDVDPQYNLTSYMGLDNEEAITIADLLTAKLNRKGLLEKEKYIQRFENIDVIAGDIDLANVEVMLMNTVAREYKLKAVINEVAEDYDYIIIDCLPSLGVLAINTLIASNRVIIPCQAEFFSVKGLNSLLETIFSIKDELNTELDVSGILLTMVNTNVKETKALVSELVLKIGSLAPTFNTFIPRSIKVAESTRNHQSMFAYSKDNAVTKMYGNFIEEMIGGI